MKVVTPHRALTALMSMAGLFVLASDVNAQAPAAAPTPTAVVTVPKAPTAPGAAPVAVSAAPQVATLTRIRQNGFITVAHRESSAPFSYVNENTKEAIGFSIDICKKIAEAVRQELKLSKLDVKYLMVKPADRLPSIKEGKADLECGNTTNNPDRRQQVSFAIPHFIDGAKLMSKGGQPPRDLAGLSGKKVVTIEKGTSEKLMNEHNAKFSTRIQVVTAKDHRESFEKLSAGEADVWMIDGMLLASHRAQSPKPTDFAISREFLTIEPLAIMYAKSDEAFGNIINKEIKRQMKTGEFQNSYRKWFNSPIPPKNINLDVPMSTLLKSFIDAPTAEMPQNF